MATLNLQVAASSDDARNINGATSKQITPVTQHLGLFSTTDYWNGFRFLNVTIPQGSTINSATLDLYSNQVTSGTTAKTIWYGVKESNTATFNTSTEYPEGKARTTATVTKDFTVSSWSGTPGFNIELVDVATLVQEIVNQGSWASGNALALVGHDNGSSTNNYVGHSTYDFSGNARGAKLVIDYTAPSSGTTVTPGVASLTLTAYTPTVTATANISVIPGVASVTITRYAPTVTATANLTITPGTAAVTTSLHLPTVTASGNVSVTPGTASILTTLHTATVTATGNISVTPGVASLTLTAQSPTVAATTGTYVTPGTESLITTAYAPMVSYTENKAVTPGAASIAITAYTPTVSTRYRIAVGGDIPAVTWSGGDSASTGTIPVGHAITDVSW